MNQVIQTKCKACHLHKTCRTVGMQGTANSVAPLKIFLDYPSVEDDSRHSFGESRTARFVNFLVARNSIPSELVDIQFTLKCAPPRNSLKKKEDKYECIDACEPLRNANLQKETKSILTMGELSCLAFTNDSLANRINTDSRCGHFYRIFVTYAPGYCLGTHGKPAEAVGLSRMLWKAAEHAGIRPKVNMKLKMFDFEII